MKEGGDGSHLTQVRNQVAIRDSGDGDVRDVLQVATENLVVMPSSWPIVSWMLPAMYGGIACAVLVDKCS